MVKKLMDNFLCVCVCFSLLLLILLLSNSSSCCAAAAEELSEDNKIIGVGVMSQGHVINLYSNGSLTFLSSGLVHSSTAASACAATRMFEQTTNRTTQVIFILNRLGTSVNLIGVDMGDGNLVENATLPFFSDKKENFDLGLDFYMNTCPNCELTNKNSQAPSSQNGKLLVTGPDELDFIHMVAVQTQATKVHFNDLLQYSGGYRLVRSVSAHNDQRNEEWLQVVYDTSLLSSSQMMLSPKTNNFATYLKRYDLQSKSVIDIIPDIATSSIIEFDSDTGALFLVGHCSHAWKETNSTKGKHCLYRVNKTTSESNPPTMEIVSTLSLEYETIMGGISLFNARERALWIIVSVNNKMSYDLITSRTLVCNENTQICQRSDDAINGSVNDDMSWTLAQINVDTGKIMSSKAINFIPESHMGGAPESRRVELITCLVSV